MTGAQASYLKTLSEEAKDLDAFDEKLTKAEASKRIDRLKDKIERMREKADEAQCLSDRSRSSARITRR